MCMKNGVYVLAVIIALTGISLGVASAAPDNGLPGILEKLEEVKQAILGLDTPDSGPLDVNVLSYPDPIVTFPTTMDVNIVSPDPVNVNVVNDDSSETYKVVSLADDEVIADGTRFEVNTAGWKTIHAHKISKTGGCGWNFVWDVEGVRVKSENMGQVSYYSNWEVAGPKLVVAAQSCGGEKDTFKLYLSK